MDRLGRMLRGIARGVLMAGIAVLAICPQLQALDAPPPSQPALDMERAVTLIRQGAAGPQIVAALEPLALEGNARAQLLLGLVYFDSKYGVTDVARACAWLRLASVSAEPAIAEQATKAMADGMARLTGADLIRADQLSAEANSKITAHFLESSGAALRQFTSELPRTFTPWISFDADVVQLNTPPLTQDDPTTRAGCAREDKGRCPSVKRIVEGPHCTGRIVQAATGAKTTGALGRDLYPPIMPSTGRRSAAGATTILAHVDSSGWVCTLVLAQSSGDVQWDAAALDAAALWRFAPATRAGQPVEALHQFAIWYRMN